MIHKNKGEIQPISVRHTHIIDNDKVRYRVYRSPTEYIAVIAENALMAMKLSGVNEPYKVMRDLHHDGVSIEASKLRDSEEIPHIHIRLTQQTADEQKSHIHGFQKLEIEHPFTPLSLGELKQPSLAGEQVVKAASLMPHITVDPLAYAMATRSDEARRMMQETAAELPTLATPEVLPELVAPVENVEPVFSEPVAATTDTPNEVLAPASTNPDEPLPLDEIARLLAEPRS
jgi:hypothetical protein